MRFALITQDTNHAARFVINPQTGDATGFMNWVDVWQGWHFSFDKTMEDISFLRNFDVVMFSGNPYNFRHIIEIANYLKDTDCVTMFYPEGSAQLYDNSINGFSPEIYEAWNACDVMSIAEEDKILYYSSFIRSDTIVRFIHVPMRPEMESMAFFVPLAHKVPFSSLVYGDNNPNHPMIAIAASAMRGLDVIAVDCDRGKAGAIHAMFPQTRFAHYHKMGQYPFLSLLGRCFVSFYPTEWIGTARHQISCAVAGTPCIGNHDSHTQKRLFPKLGCDIYDVGRMAEIFDELLEPENYNHVAEYARREVQFYSLENTKRRFMEAVETAMKIKNSRRINPVKEEVKG